MTYEELAAEVAARRNALGLSQRQAARLMDMGNWKTLYNFESGSHRPRLDTFLSIIDGLGGRIEVTWERDVALPGASAFVNAEVASGPTEKPPTSPD